MHELTFKEKSENFNYLIPLWKEKKRVRASVIFFSLIKKEIHDQFAAIFLWSAQFFFFIREKSGKFQGNVKKF